MDNPHFSFHYRSLVFREPGGTSRGVLYEKPSWIIRLEKDGNVGYGEVSLIPGLSPEIPSKVQSFLEMQAQEVQPEAWLESPALAFAWETAWNDLQNSGSFMPYPGLFTEGFQGIPINGLIWMGNQEEMLSRVQDKLDAGFRCLKLKVGAIDFEQEIAIISYLRKHFSPDDLEIRLDANGAFGSDAKEKLKRLSDFHIHSIEQPIPIRQWEHMAQLVEANDIPIALDEELIGVQDSQIMELILNTIKPHYLIFKPSLIGGFKQVLRWIELIKGTDTHWWVTSALEGNVGLNAIAQWVSHQENSLPQGLGTGGVFRNNWNCPLYLKKDALFYNPNTAWDPNL